MSLSVRAEYGEGIQHYNAAWRCGFRQGRRCSSTTAGF